MSVNIWNPWDDMLSLREAMNRLVEDSYVRPAVGGTRGNLALDVFEDADTIEVTATLPGINPEDVEITLQGDVLVIKGQQEQEQARKQGNYHLRERRTGSFYRAVQLPTLVQSDKADAEFRNGVLHLTLPKAEETKPKTIPVRNIPVQGQIGQGATGQNGHQPGQPATIEGAARPATATAEQNN